MENYSRKEANISFHYQQSLIDSNTIQKNKQHLMKYLKKIPKKFKIESIPFFFSHKGSNFKHLVSRFYDSLTKCFDLMKIVKSNKNEFLLSFETSLSILKYNSINWNEVFICGYLINEKMDQIQFVSQMKKVK